jgi:Mrp family chromosome partitioning ATPase
VTAAANLAIHGSEPASAAAENSAADEALPPAVPDHFTKIAQQIFLSPAQTVRTVVFCGAGAGAGCSWVCLKVAEALVRLTTESVCLVDGNFRAPSLHTVFGVDHAPGYSDFLAKSGPARSFARPANGRNLWLLPAGNGDSVFAAAIFRARWTQLATEFRFTLIDAGMGLEATQSAAAANGAILVVDWNKTRRDEAHRAKRSLRAAGLPLLGVVVNRTHRKIHP